LQTAWAGVGNDLIFKDARWVLTNRQAVWVPAEKKGNPFFKDGPATNYRELKEVFYYLYKTGSYNTKSMSQLFNFNGKIRGSLRTVIFSNGVKFVYYEDNSAIPKNFKFYSPVSGKLFNFVEQNLAQDKFPIGSKENLPFAIRIQGYFGERYPSNCGTIYFPNWNEFYDFSNFIY